ncbi:MAG: hypothetical protein ONB46_04950 [candidate division KSB1 bacterium]|nr:hypothetical protein [candidate division KSB1 bacterium]MDZ7365661.1 hypothetical protein [candidate division KSB1 bacterium]MDZ7403263.1 hypothetical protein [candidate division KSB1 bacterium]
MQTISEEIIEREWEKMANLRLDEVPGVIHRMEKEQPMILAFLMAIDDEIFNQEERGLLLHLGATVCEIMRQGTPRPRRVSEKRLDKFIERTDKMLEYFLDEPLENFEDAVRLIYQHHNQVNVLRYIVEALFELADHEEAPEVRDEMKGLLFMHLKTVVEALDQ